MPGTGRTETLSTHVVTSVIALGAGLGGVLNLTLEHDFAAIGLTDEDLAALARWAPDDWQRVTRQRLYVLLGVAHAGLRAQCLARAQWPAASAIPCEGIIITAPQIEQPDAMIVARLAAVALHERDNGAGRPG